jgi:hypothetical protein
MVDDPYDAELTATGGTPPYTWTYSPPLPVGLRLDSPPPGEQARIHGTPTEPTTPESVTYKITVTDATDDAGHVDLVINPKLAISMLPELPPAIRGRPYAAVLDAKGGAPPYTWKVSEAPDGLSVGADTGAIAWGTVTGATRFNVHAADNAGHTDEGQFTIRARSPRWWERFFHVGNWLGFLALGVPILGAVWIIIYAFATPGSHWTYLGVGMATALAAFLIGCLIGFLFGIPRIVSSGQARLSGYTPSSNLAEVSDWLTKLLLGAGLVQLTHLGAPIGHLINTVGAGLTATTVTSGPSSAAKVMAGGILIGYVTIGMLDSYVVTTTWYQNRLGRIG